MPAGVLPAEANEFVTDEYYGVNGRWWVQSPYDFMNLSDTYAKGYTGKGVTVGVLDDNINPYIPDFINQAVQIVQPQTMKHCPVIWIYEYMGRWCRESSWPIKTIFSACTA